MSMVCDSGSRQAGVNALPSAAEDQQTEDRDVAACFSTGGTGEKEGGLEEVVVTVFSMRGEVVYEPLGFFHNSTVFELRWRCVADT